MTDLEFDLSRPLNIKSDVAAGFTMYAFLLDNSNITFLI